MSVREAFCYKSLDYSNVKFIIDIGINNAMQFWYVSFCNYKFHGHYIA